ncbi:hypothetical protein HELRODRAFT_195006 [Helobdella robusta]|uniref:RRM domain-containing protein n=1 Tax=Helobdella robusta TaxID=6412 RepID=T1FWN1_HELRO|nr:hypothetical protein HELRODRAFT_195006 [Helobdella robusta]ESO09771.1 hypothetical protein HELRODRAFT_195006 [Helobdella robusta]
MLTVAKPKKLKVADSTSAESDDVVDEHRKIFEAMNRRQLFLKEFVAEVTEDDIRALSSDIIEVKMRNSISRNPKVKRYAYVLFESEEVAEKNHASLQGKELKGQSFVVDFVGSKSSFKNANSGGLSGHSKVQQEFDMKRLYVNGFNKKTISEEKLKEAFSGATMVNIPMKKKDNTPTGYAFLHYDDEDECKKVQKQEVLIDGKKLVIMFAKKVVPKVPELVKSSKKEKEEKKPQQPKKENAKQQQQKDETVAAPKLKNAAANNNKTKEQLLNKAKAEEQKKVLNQLKKIDDKQKGKKVELLDKKGKMAAGKDSAGKLAAKKVASAREQDMEICEKRKGHEQLDEQQS